MVELRPWLTVSGRKVCDFDGVPLLCGECPCDCDTCDALALNPPDGYTRGWRFSASGIPCGSPCYAPAQTFVLDYTDYHDTHPLWETCAWYEVREGCIHWYAITPDCRVVNWANLQICDSSSSSSSSSGSSSSGPVEGWYCQKVLRVHQNGPLYLPQMPCGRTPAEAAATFTLAEMMDICEAGIGQSEYIYNAYQLDDGGNVISGHIEADTQIGQNDPAKLWPWLAGCYNEQGEITYGEDCDHCVWSIGLDRYGDFDARRVVSTVRVAGSSQCDESQFPQENTEDDLI